MLNITYHQGNANKTTVRYHFTCVRMLTIKKREKSVGEDVEKRQPLDSIGMNVNCCSHYGKQYRVLQKINNKTTMWSTNPTSGYTWSVWKKSKCLLIQQERFVWHQCNLAAKEGGLECAWVNNDDFTGVVSGAQRCHWVSMCTVSLHSKWLS